MEILIADSGATKCEWCLDAGMEKHHFFTQGMSPYFLNGEQLKEVIVKELLPQMNGVQPQAIYFYGTGCKDPANAGKLREVLQSVFTGAKVMVTHDLMGAARALCQYSEGIACILGTGSNSCLYDGDKILKNSPGLGYVLGDEGSGAYLGKKVIQHFLYDIMDQDLKEKFEEKFHASAADILGNVYRMPLPNRYLASFTLFLSENRGHYMIENIIEDGLRDFFDIHILHYDRLNTVPVHFSGGVAYHFRDVIKNLCEVYGLSHGNVLKNPMEGLTAYHAKDIK